MAQKQPETKQAEPTKKKSRMQLHWETEERKVLEKLERIKSWPIDKQDDGRTAAEKKLSHIREEQKKLA